MTRSEILHILEQYKRDNSKKHGIRSIGIFGSQATGMASDASDVDVVVATQYPDPYTLVHIKEELEALFNRQQQALSIVNQQLFQLQPVKHCSICLKN